MSQEMNYVIDIHLIHCSIVFPLTKMDFPKIILPLLSLFLSLAAAAWFIHGLISKNSLLLHPFFPGLPD
jgi:hypothetical protein